MEQLPNELLILIFANLGPYRTVARLVCKQWKDLIGVDYEKGWKKLAMTVLKEYGPTNLGDELSPTMSAFYKGLLNGASTEELVELVLTHKMCATPVWSWDIGFGPMLRADNPYYRCHSWFTREFIKEMKDYSKEIANVVGIVAVEPRPIPPHFLFPTSTN